MFFLNPSGLFLLGALPLLAVIHFLHRRRTAVPVSTLFLMPSGALRAAAGGRWERLRSSASFLLQCCAVILLSLLMAQPVFPSAQKEVPVVLVVDSSASFSVSKERALSALDSIAADLAKIAPRTSWTVIATGSPPRLLGAQLDFGKARHLLRAFEPLERTHSAIPAIDLALSMAGSTATTLYLGDREQDELERLQHVVLLGEQITNSAFAGFEIKPNGVCDLLIRHYGNDPRTLPIDVEWELSDGTRTQAIRVASPTVPPNGLGSCSIPFPENATAGLFRLEQDRFPLDDVCHVVRPWQRKPDVIAQMDEDFRPLANRLLAAFAVQRDEGAGVPPSPTENVLHKAVRLAVYDPLAPSWPAGAAIIFLREKASPKNVRTGLLWAEGDLMKNLSWDGLLAFQGLGAPIQADSELLLAEGDRALIFLRRTPTGQQLVFNFDPRHSNLTRLPAFPLLVGRFLDRIAEELPLLERANVTTGELVRLPPTPSGSEWTLERQNATPIQGPMPAGGTHVAAPPMPGRFLVRVGTTRLFDGAANFFDPLESDFTGAQTKEWKTNSPLDPRGESARFDHWFKLILLTCIVGAWRLAR